MTARQHLNLLCWEGYDHPALLKQLDSQAKVHLNTESLVSDHIAARQIESGNTSFDVLNINNPYPKKVLYPANKIRRLDIAMLPNLDLDSRSWMSSLQDWAYGDDGTLIGICQRFGSFNLVINNQKISRELATRCGFDLPVQTDYQVPYGILQFPEFNIFHICIAAGLNPFTSLDSVQLNAFQEKAQSWFENAAIVTEDNRALNRALVSGEIGYYLSGGVFVAGAARLEGNHQVECITPTSGPIEGKGAISFVEVNSLTSSCCDFNAGHRFLNQILQPDCAVQIATNPQVCNPVMQMQDKQVFSRLSKKFLEAIQWDTLEEDISHCAMYDIPPQFPELFSRLMEASSTRTQGR